MDFSFKCPTSFYNQPTLFFERKHPNTWNSKPLREIASFCGGGTPARSNTEYWRGQIGWISSSDIQEEWIDEISISRRITEEAIQNSATKRCPPDTIAIITRVGVGKVAVMPEALCTSQDYLNITHIDGNRYFYAYQISHKMKMEAARTQGTSIKGVTADTVKSIMIESPPIEEQNYLACLLQKLDLRLKHEVSMLTSLTTMRAALLQRLFI